MSSSARLHYLVQSGVLNNDKAAAVDAYNDWQVGNCYYPTYANIFDAHTQTKRKILVPCGRCYHCYESKINEWVTRVYAHMEDFKHVYFITLTYRAFHDSDLVVNKLILDKLKDAVWHYDNLNLTGRQGLNPCLLVKSHYQNFLKRLRKYTGVSDLTYIVSGEYGHKFGRPHFHMILFSNNVINRSDIIRAWSIALWQDSAGNWSKRTNQRKNGVAYDFPIGHVDFNDLVVNGTCNTTARVRLDDRYLSVAQSISYVCKYVCKQDQANYSRVKLAYNSLFNKQTFVKVFDNELQYNIVKDYLLQVGYPINFIDTKVKQLKQFSYEKILFYPSGIFTGESFVQTRQKSLFGHKVEFEFYPTYFIDFRGAFAPFCEFSRGTPIGSIYAKNHISEFADGVFNRPILQNDGFIVPNYFRRKAKDYLYPIRRVRKSFGNFSFIYSGLVDLLRRFEKYRKNGSLPFEHFTTCKNHITYKQALQDPKRFFHDNYTGERIILANHQARYYKFDRHSRKYRNVRNLQVSDFVDYVCNILQDELDRYHKQLIINEHNDLLRSSALDLLSECVQPVSSLRDSFVKRSKIVKDSQQKLYEECHKTAE